MARFRMFLLVLLAASALRAAEPESVTVHIPVVGSVWGIGGVRWKTDVELYNDLSRPLTVWLSLPTTNAPLISVELPAHAAQRFTDIVGEAFALESALSPLEVMTEGNRSVRINANIYGVRGTEVFGPEPIAVNYGREYYPLRTLNGLSFSEEFRTNIGIANLGDKEATFVLAAQRLAGRNVAVTRLTLPPNSLSHVSIQTLFPLITKGDDFAVLVETGSPDTYVYASVIENATNIARFVEPSVGAPAWNANDLASSSP